MLVVYRVMEQNLVLSCLDAVCHNLANCESDLSPGVPQELVADIYLRSLVVNYSALNSTTLRRLRQYELKKKPPLAKARGVSDEWLMALSDEFLSECIKRSMNTETRNDLRI